MKEKQQKIIMEKDVAVIQNEINVQRCYKDTMFRMLFKEKENLLSLYNAVNKTSYTEVDDLKITTLENAVYMNYKNDVSFVFNFELMLYEHQSTVNPNMPLRNLIYVTKVLQGLTKEENLYGSRLIRLPAPRFVIFYNGRDVQPKQQVMKLSDAFIKKQEEPELEVTVKAYNINWGYNRELMESCVLLKEYAQYVEEVRKLAKRMPYEEAVEQAVDYCIRNDILAEFLSKNRAEAVAVSIFEYNEEQHLKSEREEWLEKGIEQGIEQGIKSLIETSMELGSTKQETVERVMKKLQVSREKAEESIEKYWHQ